MTQQPQLVDRGRGLQLSTSRIRVQDLVPYLQQRWTYERILEGIPSLTRDEFELIRRYYADHQIELDEESSRIEEYHERCRQEQLARPEFQAMLKRSAEKMAALREQFKKQRELSERNGDQPAG